MFKIFKPQKRRLQQNQISSSMPHKKYHDNQSSKSKIKTSRPSNFIFTPLSSQGSRQFNSMTSRNSNKTFLINEDNFYSLLKKNIQDKKKIYSSQKSLRRNQSSLTKRNLAPYSSSFMNLINLKDQNNLKLNQTQTCQSFPRQKFSIKEWNKIMLKQNAKQQNPIKNNLRKSTQRILKKKDISTLRIQQLKKSQINQMNQIDSSNRFQQQIEQQKNKSKTTSQYCKVIIHDERSQQKQISVRYKVKKIGTFVQFLKNFMKNYYQKQTQQSRLQKESQIQQKGEIVSFQTVDYNLQLDYYLTLQNQDGSFLNGQTIVLRPLYSLKQPSVNLNSFEIIQCIGSGGFSTVFLCRFKQNYKFYAMKVISKPFIVKNDKKKIIKNQRNIMVQLRNKMNLSKLFFSFQTKQYLVFVMEYYAGGELFNLVKRFRKMDQDMAKFYITQILIGLEQIHSHDIVYRDFKPQNIMIDIEGHAFIADFGLAKPNISMNGERAYSFCGSPQYMPPQMIMKQGHSLPVDFYCIGALLYQLVTGLPPFYSTDPENIYQSTLNEELSFPNHVNLSPQLQDLLIGLLCKDQRYRIGTRYGVQQVLSHRWFRNVNLQDFLNKKIKAPVNFKKIQDLRFNIDQMQQENQKQMKEILKNQKIEMSAKYLKIMNGFYYDYRVQQQEQSGIDDREKQIRNFKKQKNRISIQKSKNNSSSLALTNCTKRSQGSLNLGNGIHNNSKRSGQKINMRQFLKNGYSGMGERQNSLNKYKKQMIKSSKDIDNNKNQSVQQRLFKNLNNYLS